MTLTLDPPAAAAPPTPAPPRRLTRRQFFRRAGLLAAAPMAVGAYATQVEPFWPRLREMAMPIRRLPAAFDGYRVLHLTDLHAGYTVWSYLVKTLRRTTALRPDLVLVTGDVVNHHRKWVEPIATLLGETFVAAGVPTVVSFGNHDFGYARRADEPPDDDLHLVLEASLTAHGCTVLRNRSHAIDRGGSRLWTVGLDDLWFGQFDADVAFAGVPADEPRIALSHNPDTAPHLARFAPDLILSGHTHGGQINLPLWGPPLLNVADTTRAHGLFDVGGGSQLYVSSGVGYIRRVRLNCRPEAVLFRLRAIRLSDSPPLARARQLDGRVIQTQLHERRSAHGCEAPVVIIGTS